MTTYTGAILRFALSTTDASLSSATLNELVDVLRIRYQAVSEINPLRRKEVGKLQMSLSETVDRELVEKICQDEIMIDILKEFMDRNISVKEIINAIASSEKCTISEKIPQLINNKPEISEEAEKSAFKTADDLENNAQFNPNLQFNTPSLGRGHSTPYTQALRNNFSTNINSNINTLRQNSTLAPLKNLSIKDVLDCIPKFDGSNIPLTRGAPGMRVLDLAKTAGGASSS